MYILLKRIEMLKMYKTTQLILLWTKTGTQSVMMRLKDDFGLKTKTKQNTHLNATCIDH